jgi:hypothetical protein
VLALLAIACVPALAQADCTDSSCAQYEVEIPSAEGKSNKGDKSNGQEPSAGTSTDNGGNAATPSGEEGSEEDEKSKAGGAPGKGSGGPGDKNGSSSGGSGGGQGSEGLNESQPVTGAQSGEQASHSSGGGSSPLVPILIAVAVLAAISIGAVIYRQRRQGDGGSGSPVSPKAG